MPPDIRKPASELSSGLLVRVSLFAVLTAAGSYIIIPLPYSPVPVTLQNLFVMLSGVLIGGKAAFLSQCLYIIMGAAGLPVFAGGGSGIGYLLGPTGGFIAGFAAGALICGLLAERGRPFFGMFTGWAVIYAIGVPALGAVTGRTLIEAAAIGFLPFIPGDIIKFAAAAGIYRQLQSSGAINR